MLLPPGKLVPSTRDLSLPQPGLNVALEYALDIQGLTAALELVGLTTALDLNGGGSRRGLVSVIDLLSALATVPWVSSDHLHQNDGCSEF